MAMEAEAATPGWALAETDINWDRFCSFAFPFPILFLGWVQFIFPSEPILGFVYLGKFLMAE